MKKSSIVLLGFALLTGCSTLPDVKHKSYSFPTGRAYLGDAQQPYEKLGLVRSKVNYQSLDPAREEDDLCKNYYNKSVSDLLKFSKDKGGDAVIHVKSVVFLEDGRQELYSTPECADDGLEGQILTQGIAIRWLREEKKKDSVSQK